MIYIIGKLKAYASRICNNFQAERSFEGHLDIMTSMTKTFSYPGMIKDVKKTQLFLGSLYMSYINSYGFSASHCLNKCPVALSDLST